MSATNSPALEQAPARRRTRLRNTTSVLAKNQDVLAGKVLQDLLQPESFGFQFRLNLRDGHLVLLANGDLGILLAVLQQHQPPVRFQ